MWLSTQRGPQAIESLPKEPQYSVIYIRDILSCRENGFNKSGYQYYVRWYKHEPECDWIDMDLSALWAQYRQFLPRHFKYNEEYHKLEYVNYADIVAK